MSRLRRDEGGVIAVLVALLMTTVLLGFGAVVVDVGSLNGERRQLQNGADAGAVAVAQDCGAPLTSTCDVSTSNGATAGKYAGDNANDTKSNVDRVCGRGNAALTACPAKQGAWDCAPIPSSGPLAGAPYVQVQTSTQQTGGSTLMPPVLAQVLSGANTGTTVRSCARASWGAASSLAALPLTVSDCTFTKALPLKPVPPPLSTPKVFYVHDKTNVGGDQCVDAHSGNAIPGGFGYLSTTNGACSAQSDTSQWFWDSTGNSPPNPCSPAQFKALLGTIVDIPIFDDVNGSPGSNGKYQMIGYAGFYLTGYQLGGQYKEKDLVTNSFPCSSPNTCVSGFFTSDPQPSPGTIGGPPGTTGVVVIQMSG